MYIFVLFPLPRSSEPRNDGETGEEISYIKIHHSAGSSGNEKSISINTDGLSILIPRKVNTIRY